MKSSYRIFRIFGIDVELHLSFIFIFLIILFFISLYGSSKDSGLGSLFSGADYGMRVVVLFILLFGIVLMHELAHSLVAIKNNIKVPRIVLTPIGGIANIEVPENPDIELKTSVIGPLSNYIVVIIFLPVVILLWPEYLQLPNLYQYVFIDNVFRDIFSIPEIFLIIIALNLLLGSFNLIPAFPMDGGRVLRSVMALWLDYVESTVIAVRISQVIAIIMFFMAPFTGIIMIFISIFILIAGSNELKIVKLRHVFHSVKMGNIAIKKIRYVNEHISISDFLKLIAQVKQRHYPVVDYNKKVVGILDIEAISKINPKKLDIISVDRVARRKFDIIDANKNVSNAISQILGKEFTLVVDSGQVVGYITPEHVFEIAQFYSISRKINM